MTEEHGEKSGILMTCIMARRQSRINDNIRFCTLKTGKELPYRQGTRDINRNTIMQGIKNRQEQVMAQHSSSSLLQQKACCNSATGFL
jgi:hypothetical protein